MAVNPLTPGVYIDEISVFPPSVAPVATAVPAFIGYTEKGPVMVPTRITSMLDYEQIFGGANAETFDVDPTVSPIDVDRTTANQKFNLHYNLRMYFANGGGPCYIVSVDVAYYSSTISHLKLIDGINSTEKADEVTLLVVPEAVGLTGAGQIAAVHSAQLDLCNKMKDRFSIMDVITTSNITNDATAFRNSDTGNNNLKYGAAYYPKLNTTQTLSYSDSDVSIVAGTFDTLTLTDVKNGVAATGTIQVTNGITAGQKVTIGTVTFEAKVTPGTPTNTTCDFALMPNAGPYTGIATAASLAAAINTHSVAKLLVSASSSANIVEVKALSAGAVGNSIAFTDNGGAELSAIPGGAATVTLDDRGLDADITLYNSITAKILAEYTVQLYPSSTMAGIYASVDRDRGVWKAPANVSLTGVVSPSVNISAAEQENLNVDATSGKSINAIRAFAGKGILVWGGRTLAGNDNEWRYINVRRLFIFAEESIQKASEFVIFEPNDANTWSRVRSLIGNFLTNLWRDGALAGATPAQAFLVRVGLGETMTAQDILEGKMIIEVGLAAVRPAEFIILKFSHKLQEA